MPIRANHTLSEGHCYPLSLCEDWPRAGRLLFMVVCCFIGTLMNSFFVASFFIEPSLKKVGNVFLACAGVADLTITSVVMIGSSVVLLSGQWENDFVCHSLQVVTIASTYCYSLYFTLIAAETYCRVCCVSANYRKFISMPVTTVAVSICITSTLVATFGVFFKLDYDYCQRLHAGNIYFRIMTAALFYGMPFVLIWFSLVASCIRVIDRARRNLQYRRSLKCKGDYASATLNTAAYFLFVLFWLPSFTHLHKYGVMSDFKYYNFIWIGLLRTVLTSFVYGIFNQSFSTAYAKLFRYCFCKHNLPRSSAVRRRRVTEFNFAMGNIGVHRRQPRLGEMIRIFESTV